MIHSYSLHHAIKILAVALTIFCITGPAQADLQVFAKTNYYSVSGDSPAELKHQMGRKGQNGWWGYTRWYVRWTQDCRVTVTVTYTMPRWIDKHSAPVALRVIWERMLANLWTHEKGHAQFGINAAREIKRSNCSDNPHAIIRKWAHQDKVYDNRTQSGLTQGVAM